MEGRRKMLHSVVFSGFLWAFSESGFDATHGDRRRFGNGPLRGDWSRRGGSFGICTKGRGSSE